MRPAVFGTAIKTFADRDAFALRHMHTTVSAGQHPLGLRPGSIDGSAIAGLLARLAQGAPDPPHPDQRNDEKQQITHGDRLPGKKLEFDSSRAPETTRRPVAAACAKRIHSAFRAS